MKYDYYGGDMQTVPKVDVPHYKAMIDSFLAF